MQDADHVQVCPIQLVKNEVRSDCKLEIAITDIDRTSASLPSAKVIESSEETGMIKICLFQ